MNGLFEAAREVCEYFEQKDFAYCLIGGVALLRWGEPRTTKNVDFTFWTGFEDKERLIDEFLQRFASRISDPVSFALEYRILLISASNGAPVDVSLAGLPFEEGVIERATSYAFSSTFTGRTCCAEDLIVLKAFADRPQDWVDIPNVITRQGAALDWDAILERFAALAEYRDPSLVTKLARLRPA